MATEDNVNIFKDDETRKDVLEIKTNGFGDFEIIEGVREDGTPSVRFAYDSRACGSEVLSKSELEAVVSFLKRFVD